MVSQLADVVTPRGDTGTRMWPEDLAQRLTSLKHAIDELEARNTGLVAQRNLVCQKDTEEVEGLVAQIERELNERAEGLDNAQAYLAEIRGLVMGLQSRLGVEGSPGEAASDNDLSGGIGKEDSPPDAEKLDAPFLRRLYRRVRSFFRR